MTLIITHTYTSYKITGESSSSSDRRVGGSISAGDPSTEGARGQGTRRGTPEVRGPPA
jgi:hypothetical protein